MLEELTGRPVLGVLPHTDGIAVDAEDAIDWALLQSGGPPRGDDVLRISVVALPRMSNHTDVDALTCEPGVVVRFARQAAELAGADLVILPGSRATVADLAWLRERQMDEAIVRHAARGLPVLGICGGYQMLGTLIDDDVESGAGRVRGLAMLPVRTEFGREKVLARPFRTLADGVVVHGYEIHHGAVSRDGGEPFFADEGCRVEAVAGTQWHGLMENDGFRREYLSYVARVAGRSFTGADDVCFDAIREAKLDRLADLVADHLDSDGVRALLDFGPPPLPSVRLTLQAGSGG
jgi:adenosylcobyric acid synthase